MAEQRIQRIVIPDLLLVSIFCPFCGKEVVEALPEGDDVIYSECPHTLFICTDEGFVYRSGAFDVNLNCLGVEDKDLPLDDSGYDEFTSRCTVESSFKIATYDDPPSNFGFYIGFFANN